MGLFNSTCCPSKPKRTMDYILNWIDTNSLIISKNTSFINDLLEWRRTIENDLYDHVKDVADEYITNYDWSEVPQFDVLSRSIATKADKTIPIAADSIALLDVNGNLKDSKYKVSDFAAVNHSHNGINLGGNVANHILIEETGSIGRFHVQLWDSQEEEPVFSDYITATMLSNIFNPATAPAQGSQKLITSGAVYNYSPRAISNAGHGVSVDEDGKVHIGSDYVVIGVDGGEAEINSENIDNLNRALATPSSTPEDDATKLITSKAVYDALSNISPTGIYTVNYSSVSSGNAYISIANSTTVGTYNSFVEFISDNSSSIVSIFLTKASSNNLSCLATLVIGEENTDSVTGNSYWVCKLMIGNMEYKCNVQDDTEANSTFALQS